MMAGRYGLTYGLAKIGTEMMPAYYAAEKRALESEKQQMGVEQLRQEMEQERLSQAQKAQKDALKQQLDSAYRGLISGDLRSASQYFGAPIEMDQSGDYIVTNPNTGYKHKTKRGELFAAISGPDALAKYAQGMEEAEMLSARKEEEANARLERQKLIGQQQMERQNRSFEQRKQLLELGGAIKARLSGMGEKGKAVSGRVAQFFALRQDNIDKGMSPPEADQNARDAVFGDRFKDEAFALRGLIAQLGGATRTWNMDDVNRFTAAIGDLIKPKEKAPRQNAPATSDGRPSKAARPGTEWRNLPGIGWREIPVKK